ncbi:MAG: signal peptidase II [Dethiosulfatibacter sp.]|nr:signal peptidase II [Dethiosulfatibacter sp.]
MFYYLGILFLVALDQLAKYLAVKYLLPLNTLPLWQNVLHLTYAENTGAAFGMLSGKQLFLIGVTSIVILAMLIVLQRFINNPQETWLKLSLVLLISGGLGNLTDRIRLDYVVDFIDFRLINFAIFNTADSLVSVGTVLLLYVVLFNKTKMKL